VVSITEAIRPHERLGLDTSAFIYHIEAGTPFAGAAGQVLQTLNRRSVSGVTSVLTLTELLVKPLQVGRRGLAGRYEELVRSTPGLAVVDVDAWIARTAAALRATYNLRTADAIQVATAIEHGATAFVTNDSRLRRIRELTVIMLSDHVDEQPYLARVDPSAES
jgi:predicted nucleic acid-binding protein